MVLETVRILAAALASPTYGVSVQLDAMDTASLIAPGERPPAPGTIANVFDHDHRLRFHDFATSAIQVAVGSSDGDLEDGPSQQVRDETIPVVVRYVAKDASTPAGLRAASYTLRAALRSIVHLTDKASAVDRALQGIHLTAIPSTSLALSELQESQAPQLVGEIRLDAQVRDLNP